MFHNRQVEELQASVDQLTEVIAHMSMVLGHAHAVAVRTETRLCRVATHLNAPFQPDPAKMSTHTYFTKEPA